jgi:hypothetical protein
MLKERERPNDSSAFEKKTHARYACQIRIAAGHSPDAKQKSKSVDAVRIAEQGFAS